MKTFRFGLWRTATIGQLKLHLPLMVAGLCSAALLFVPAAATAVTVVTTTADSGAGSLRNAVSSEPANGTITFAGNLSGQTILLASGPISVTKNVTINASALANGILIDGNHASRVFDVLGVGTVVNVVLNSLTLTNGYNASGGGAIACSSGNLTFNNCKLVNNQCGGYGGALSISAAGNVTTLTMNATTVSGNSGANFAAMYVEGVANINNCTFSGNSGTNSALRFVGMQFFGWGVSIVNSTFSGNVTGGGGSGAAISAFSAGGNITMSLTSCTVVSNVINAGGGPKAIYLETGTSLSLNNSIVSGNTGGSAVEVSGNVNAGLSAFNLVGAATNLVNGVNNNQVGITNPLLAALGNYGGPTQTMPPLLGSPAINAGGGVSEPTDQRGLPRLFGSAVDIGAVELQGSVVTTTADSGPGSLRDAVALVPNGGSVTFATNLSGQTITLTSGQLVLNNANVTIDASALTNGVAINGNANSRIFQVNTGASLVLNGLTLTNGNAQSDSGGAIVNLGTLAVANCTLAANTGASGGAISNNAICTLQNSTCYGNSATTGNGGAVANAASATLNLLHCTLSGNSTIGNGGGIDNSLGLVNVTNTIIAGNTGSDIYNGSGSTITCGGSNIVQVLGNAGTVLGNNTLLAVNPLLGQLTNNGGPTLTLLPQSASPAINAGISSAAANLVTDQRGFSRLLGSAVDIGAVEFQFPSVVTLPASGVTTNAATLNGALNPSDVVTTTTVYFQYGFTTNYGSATAAINLGSSNSATAFSAVIAVSAGVTYHFRAVASTADGLRYGTDSIVSRQIPHVFTGAELGQGLDLQGSFLYAVDLGGNGAPGLIGDANFTADNISGVTITTPGGTLNTVTNFANPNFGATPNGLRLTQVISSIRWTPAPTVLTVNMSGLQVGAGYKFQLLFIESGFDRVFNVTVDGTTIIPNFRLLNYGPAGTPIVIPYVFTAASTNALIQLGGGVGGTDNNPQMSGFTLETLEPEAVPTLPPTVMTLPASSTSATSAILNGTVNPNESATIAYFQYGLTTNYGSFTGTNSLPGTNAAVTVSNLISGLLPSATYHYRLVASNAFGTASGADLTIGGISPHVFTGAEPGQGLDLQGSFLYAVNVGNNGVPGLMGDANFTADNVSGVTITTPGGVLNTINNWASPNFGGTTAGLRLTQVMSSIRWTPAPATFTVNLTGLQAGASYQLQLLFIESLVDRVFNVIVNGATVVPNFRLLDYGPSGTPIVVPYIFTAASSNALIQMAGGVGGTDHNPQMSGFTLETLASATTPTPSVIDSVTIAGTNLISVVTNGVPNGGWTWLTATNLAPPVIWSTNRTGTFDGQGNVVLTNDILSTEPARYFIIRAP